MIKRICDLCTNDGEICHIARYKDADGDVVTIEAMLRPNYRGVVEWIYSQWQVVLHCVNAAKAGISDGMNQGLNDIGLDEGERFNDLLVIGNVHQNPELITLTERAAKIQEDV